MSKTIQNTESNKFSSALSRLQATIEARAADPSPASHTTQLLAGGPLLCAKKLIEEAGELALALAAQGKQEAAHETADLLYHLMVALQAKGVSLDQVADILKAREGRSGLQEKADRT